MKELVCGVCGGGSQMWYEGLYDDRYAYPGEFALYKCTRCGFAQTFPKIPKQEMTRLYTRYYPRKDFKVEYIKALAKAIPSYWVRWLKGLGSTAHYWVPQGKFRSLDVGSGSGVSLLELAKLGHEVYGLEPDRNTIRMAKELNLKVHFGFIENCPFPKNFFDYITASQVIEHTSDPVKFVLECKKFLSDTGKMIITTPNIEALHCRLTGRKWVHWHIPYHQCFLTKRTWTEVAMRTGMKVVMMRTVTPNLWTVLQFRKLLAKSKEEEWAIWRTSTDNGMVRKRNVGDKLLTGLLLIAENFWVENRLVDTLNWGESWVVTLEKQL
ncbi:hypothetical protein A3D85_01090 [Candidatus Amesbacteria bacterium RIFCSPHIGHO2_02_FULL_47_9]|uniref:Methyltransferase type 11 domain-containing protein n=1 Tax=Candidatus Amesbacteria bacterium RIFCSPHIGHO2_01_FULL_48_32b TaxID=1797253 RepID=A0A1F4YDA9_9BACT|nr:MAG: hypothetical protein A2876_03195 [Candidatus Amesbacteria bacterium RIFCSPHIGHO2_01_FULL_48_32b]OGD02940.1 MAG: hypothetical protein A3D85_01090 [Candidatus Amesbacteria bacterium RIFCSPHIGHO2_02_FULL_47_9]OGD08458.1 MAG: hypothetical protein A2899_01535 [Candidatus Amesbacteria bacterium RIFCSPLOWO2_01_FULL_49_25]